MNAEQVVEVLRQVEWVGLWDYPKYACVCVSCDALESEGHRDDCKLAALLGEARREQPPRKMSDKLDALAERVLGEVEAIVAESIESSAEEMEKEATVAQDYERAMEAVGVAARAALRDFEGVWLSQRMRELGKALEVMDKARERFFKERR